LPPPPNSDSCEEEIRGLRSGSEEKIIADFFFGRCLVGPVVLSVKAEMSDIENIERNRKRLNNCILRLKALFNEPSKNY